MLSREALKYTYSEEKYDGMRVKCWNCNTISLRGQGDCCSNPQYRPFKEYDDHEYTAEVHFTPGNPALTGECFKSRDDPHNKAKRYNSGKPQLSYVMSTGVALDGVANVMEFGAKKYDRDNWKKGLHPTSILDSMIRHILKYFDGEYLDSDSGLPHIDHISCNALFLGYHTNRETQDGMKNVK